MSCKPPVVAREVLSWWLSLFSLPLNYFLVYDIFPCMDEIATITSKRQLTLPVRIFRELALELGEKVIVTIKDGNIVLIPATKYVAQLAGAVSRKTSKRAKNLETAIELAKRRHFSEKYPKKVNK